MYKDAACPVVWTTSHKSVKSEGEGLAAPAHSLPNNDRRSEVQLSNSPSQGNLLALQALQLPSSDSMSFRKSRHFTRLHSSDTVQLHSSCHFPLNSSLRWKTPGHEMGKKDETIQRPKLRTLPDQAPCAPGNFHKTSGADESERRKKSQSERC
ncbi:unnamed protein product [Pleuronectes platessa]|uniref:Uncharacterized protein n=1 Tax=Pleuronectes platessa TaxID=8262 RepID=A0A9N7UII5_PLEPL|nr:unnamed protein product [Pleuronectes platessa]